MSNPTPPVVPVIVQTPEQIAKHYSACIDSVNLINTLNAKPTKTQDDLDTIKRNVDHLIIMRAKTFWTSEDMTPIIAAIGS
jgi:hypothetical protein